METKKEKSAATRTVVGGGIGGALGVLAVLFLPDLTGLVMSADKPGMCPADSTPVHKAVKRPPAAEGRENDFVVREVGDHRFQPIGGG